MADNVDEYGICTKCGYRAKVACICDLTFAEKIRTVGVDEEALRRLKYDGWKKK